MKTDDYNLDYDNDGSYFIHCNVELLLNLPTMLVHCDTCYGKDYS